MAKQSENKSKILRMLAPGELITGESMSAALGISRAAVWKYIEQLRAEDYRIQTAGKNGYRLESPPGDLRPGALWRNLDTAWAGQSMEYHDSLVSTNATACDRAREGFPHGHVVLAAQQTGGLGRRQRSWFSPKGAGVYLSIILRPDLPPAQAALLTMLCALAAADALAGLGIESGIKWPNDIVAADKKVCGMLLQMSANMEAMDWVVAGLGMNFLAPELPELRETATGLEIVAGRPLPRDDYVLSLLKHIENRYAQLPNLLDDYRAKLVNIGKPVRVFETNREWEGFAKDVDESGALLVEDASGKTHRLLAGDVSVRGLMGYV